MEDRTSVSREPSVVTLNLPDDFDGAIALLIERIERVLTDVPENKLEARRYLTQELGFGPTAVELQAILTVAHDATSRGLPRTLSRTALSAMVLARLDLAAIFGSADLDPKALALSAQRIPGLIRMVSSLEDEIRSRLDSWSDEERDLMLQVGDALLPDVDPLVGACVLLPRLRMFAADEDPGEKTVNPERSVEDEDPSSRVIVNSVAMRAILEEDVEAWNAANESVRGKLIEKLELTKTAYHVVAGELQKRHDEALVAGLRAYPEELRVAKQCLFSAYLQLAPILTNGGHSRTNDAANLNDMVEQAVAGDVAAEAAAHEVKQKQAANEELYVTALDDGKSRRKRSKPRRPGHRPKDKTGSVALVVLAAALFVGCLVIYVPMFTDKPVDPWLASTELPDALAIRTAMVVGPLLYAEVNRWVWDGLTPGERVARVQELADDVRGGGYETIYLNDEGGEHLALWSRDEGIQLAGVAVSYP